MYRPIRSERVVSAYEAGEGDQVEVARLFHVGEATVRRWWALKRKTGSVAAKAPAAERPARRSLDADGEAKLVALVAATPDALRRFTAGYFDAGDPTCRSGPGGALAYGGLVGGSTVVYDGDVTRGADPASATLGGVAESPLVACAPDLDGDGREELVFGAGPYDEQLGVVFAATLAPGDLIDPTAEGLRIASGDPVVAGSLGAEDVWVFEGGSPGLGWYVPPGDGTLGAFTQAAEIESVGHGWLDPVIGGPEPDLVVHGHLGDWEYGFFGVDGAHPSEAVLLVPTVPHENELWDWDAGGGPDVFGAGVDSFWVRYRPEGTMRPVVELVAARPR